MGRGNIPLLLLSTHYLAILPPRSPMCHLLAAHRPYDDQRKHEERGQKLYTTSDSSHGFDECQKLLRATIKGGTTNDSRSGARQRPAAVDRSSIAHMTINAGRTNDHARSRRTTINGAWRMSTDMAHDDALPPSLILHASLILTTIHSAPTMVSRLENHVVPHEPSEPALRTCCRVSSVLAAL
jgi:hypothetical protein